MQIDSSYLLSPQAERLTRSSARSHSLVRRIGEPNCWSELPPELDLGSALALGYAHTSSLLSTGELGQSKHMDEPFCCMNGGSSTYQVEPAGVNLLRSKIVTWADWQGNGSNKSGFMKKHDKQLSCSGIEPLDGNCGMKRPSVSSCDSCLCSGALLPLYVESKLQSGCL